MASQSSNKTIAKNTLMLYIRMMVIMVISLYTSRVVLKTLGIEDYGLYQAVGGIVGFMAVLNSALSAGSGRFLTFALGKGDKSELKNTFSTVLLVHISLALLIVLLAETVGLWYLYNKMVIPAERFSAAIWVYHISILTAAINITQVPYTGCITAHERFNLYAYVSIVEAVLKLTIVYLLTIGSWDKLVLYAVLYFSVQALLQLFYRWYCRTRFSECKFSFVFDRTIFTPIIKFSSWNLLANVTIALNNQGVLLLLNAFFSPAVVAARALSLQVDSVVKQFVNNFKIASNPQIIKKYASGDTAGSKVLLFQTSNWAFFLMIILCAPIFVCASPLLSLWLDNVPEYTIPFLQIIMFQGLFSVFDSCFYQAFNANGRLKENALVSPAINLLRFVVIYFCFKQGVSPLALSYAGVVANFLIACVAKPYLMVRFLGYEWRDFIQVIKPCSKVAIPVVIISGLLAYFVQNSSYSTIQYLLTIMPISFMITLSFVWYVGLDKGVRTSIINIAKSKLIR